MFCGSCGTENPSGAKCCKACGKRLDGYLITPGAVPPAQMPYHTQAPGGAAPVSPTPGGAAPVATAPGAPMAAPRRAAGGPNLVVISIIVGTIVIVLLSLMAFVMVSNRNTINLNDYMQIEITGYDGYGTAKAVIDWEAIQDKYGKKISFTKAAANEYGALLSLVTPVEVLSEDVTLTLDPYTQLSNGDTVSYSWNIDDEVAEILKCKLKYKDGTTTAENLQKIGTFDAFADLKVTFSGIAPYGKMAIEYTGTELSQYNFSYENTGALSNGDTVKVMIDESTAEDCAQAYGKVPAALEKEYTVEGLSSYVTKLSEISEDGLAKMQKEAEDAFHADVAKKWEDYITLDSLTYLGDYLLTAKTDVYGSQSTLYLVYKAKSKIAYTNSDNQSYNAVKDIYWYISFRDLQVEADGTLSVDLTNYSTANQSFSVDSGISDGYFSNQTWYYTGYETLDALYKDAVTSYIDSYNHEDNVDQTLAAA